MKERASDAPDLDSLAPGMAPREASHITLFSEMTQNIVTFIEQSNPLPGYHISDCLRFRQR